MMIEKGIYTLANDNLYDQVIALVNSIRQNYDQKIPICIIPYDDKISKLKSLNLENVFLFNNAESLTMWGNFALEVWSHNHFLNIKQSAAWYHSSNTMRKLCAFDGIFKKFIYIDSDELVMSSLANCFAKLNEYDCVFDDWEHKKQSCFLAVDLIQEKYDISEQFIRQHCHCSDFFAAKSSLINNQVIQELKYSLLVDGEVSFINSQGWWDEVYLFSYITFKLNCKIFNYTLSLNSQERTGNIAGVDPFVEQDHVLFNQEGLKSIHRIHYMGYKSERFTRLCQGEDTNIPHQEIFLYYRFMHQPEAAPKSLKRPNLTVKIERFIQKLRNRIKKKLPVWQ